MRVGKAHYGSPEPVRSVMEETQHAEPGDLDTRFMQRALELAAETAALASPNPQVGCVLTRNHQIIAEGAHLYDLYDHAEIVALKQAAKRNISVEGATAYVTLEPCSHHGRTGPCADALIAARLGRVVVAAQDPNPKVSGHGIARLRAAGVEVTLNVLRREAQDLNNPFAHFIQHHRPFVTLKAALSTDGKLAPANRTTIEPHWLTGQAARADVQHLRHASDAILSGIGTILADDPALTDRTDLPRRRRLLRVILDPQLRLPLHSQVARSSDRDILILCAESAATTKAVALGNAGIDVEHIPSHNDRLSLPAVITTLAERDILSLLLETGSILNGAFLDQDLVDRVILYYADTELGPKAIPFAANVSPILLQQRLQRQTRASFPHGQAEDIRVAGYLRYPWPNQLT